MYVEVTSKRIENFLRAHHSHYKKIFYYLKPGSESAQALKIACKKLGIKPIACVSPDKFDRFKETLKKNPLAEEIFLSDLKLTLVKNIQ